MVCPNTLRTVEVLAVFFSSPRLPTTLGTPRLTQRTLISTTKINFSTEEQTQTWFWHTKVYGLLLQKNEGTMINNSGLRQLRQIWKTLNVKRRRLHRSRGLGRRTVSNIHVHIFCMYIVASGPSVTVAILMGRLWIEADLSDKNVR